MIRRREFIAELGEALASQPSLDEPHVASCHLTAAYFETSPIWQKSVSSHASPNAIALASRGLGNVTSLLVICYGANFYT
jgi:hypothetical protein